MDKLAKLMQDIAILWDKYHPMYLRGMLSTLGLALAATAIGCIIGLACGILNTKMCIRDRSEKDGFFTALDLGSVWLARALKDAKK